MSELIRFGVSMDSRLLSRFDDLIAEKGYSNRSEAIRDLIRDELVEQSWEEEEGETVGTITLVYDHEMHDLTEKLIDYQHQVHGAVISSLHVHLDEHNCLEVLVVRGKGRGSWSQPQREGISTERVWYNCPPIWPPPRDQDSVRMSNFPFVIRYIRRVVLVKTSLS
jgi:CopG family nickel-responsive transcriptional regulator